MFMRKRVKKEKKNFSYQNNASFFSLDKRNLRKFSLRGRIVMKVDLKEQSSSTVKNLRRMIFGEKK